MPTYTDAPIPQPPGMPPPTGMSPYGVPGNGYGGGIPLSPNGVFGGTQLTGGVNTTGWDPGRLAELLARQQASGVQGTTIESPWSNYQAQQQINYQDPMQQALGNANQTYQQQQQFVQALQQQALGAGGPSVAQGMLNQATQQNLQNQAGAVASNRNLSPAQAARIQMEGGANTQNQAAGQAATLRSQEMLNAQQQLGGALGTMGAQQLGAAGNFGQLAGQQSLGVQGINAGVAQGNLNANFGQQTANVNQQNANWGPISSIVGGITGGAGAAGAMAGGGAGASYAGGAGASGGLTGGPAAMIMASGGGVPGQAMVPGDSPMNDRVPTWLSPGEEVIPRSVMQSPNPEAAVVAFLRATRGQSGHAGGFDEGGPVADTEQIPFGQAMSEGIAPLTDAASSFIDRNYSTAPPPPQLGPEAVPLDLPPTQGPGALVAPAPAAPAQAPQSMIAPTASGTPRDFTQAQNAEQAAVAQGAQVAEQKAGEESGIAAAQSAATQELAQRSAQQAADRQKGADQLFSDYASSKLHPNHYWASLGTGGQITSAISLILGGLGAGLTHGPNLALGVIDKAIDRDMDAQKVEMGKKENALKFYMAQTGNMQQAMALTKADARDVAAAQMSAASLKYASPAIAAQTAQAIATMRKQSVTERLAVQQQQNATTMSNLQLQGAAYQQQLYRSMAQNGPGATQGAQQEMSPEEQMMHLSFAAKGPEGIQQKAAHTVMVPDTVQIPTGRNGETVPQVRMVPRTALTPEAATGARGDLKSVGMMQNKVDVLDNLAKKYPHGNAIGVMQPADETAAKAAVAAIKEQFDRGFNLVNAQPSKETTELTDQIVKNPLDFFQNSARARASIDFLKNEIQGTKKLILQGSVFPRKGD